MKFTKKIAGVLAAALLLVSGASEATLMNRGGGMVYDSVLDVTWLQDANYAMTSGFDTDGMMRRNVAVNWANGLTYGGYNDWRLPTAVRTDRACSDGFNLGGTPEDSYGFGCGRSEMAHMFKNNLGLKGFESSAGLPETNWGLFADGQNHFGEQLDVGLFKNVQASLYWYRTNFALDSSMSWAFNFDQGEQFPFFRNIPGVGQVEMFAWVLRDGDVAQVPEPSSLVLLGLALAGLGVAKRRQSGRA